LLRLAIALVLDYDRDMSKSNSFWDHPIETLEEALSVRKQIHALQEKLSTLFGDHPPSLSGIQKTSKRTMSAAGRAKIRAAAKARWAKIKGTAAKTSVNGVKSLKKKSKMSSETRAKLAAAMKARWAARKKGAVALNVKK
jgi:hypothetical protein